MLVERTGSVLRFAALCTGVIFSGLVFAKSQTVSFLTDTTHFYPSEAFEISVAYETSDKSLATGMGIHKVAILFLAPSLCMTLNPMRANNYSSTECN
tara:strand:- start:69 stop:359 length:291 start_codon:yes stop_codon:yes gene_type:complete